MHSLLIKQGSKELQAVFFETFRTPNIIKLYMSITYKVSRFATIRNEEDLLKNRTNVRSINKFEKTRISKLTIKKYRITVHIYCFTIIIT